LSINIILTLKTFKNIFCQSSSILYPYHYILRFRKRWVNDRSSKYIIQDA
jgi:hypothetical protein